MALVVTTRVTQVGSTLSGDVVAVIVVHTNTGYSPNVGHAGTGTWSALSASASVRSLAPRVPHE
jgi:hypothetical protein